MREMRAKVMRARETRARVKRPKGDRYSCCWKSEVLRNVASHPISLTFPSIARLILARCILARSSLGRFTLARIFYPLIFRFSPSSWAFHDGAASVPAAFLVVTGAGSGFSSASPKCSSGRRSPVIEHTSGSVRSQPGR